MSQALSAFRQMQQQSQPPQPPVQLGPAISGRKRRSKVLLTTVVTILAATAMLVVVNVVSERYHARLDMTATGSQKLSPRTERVLARLPGPVRIVVATDLKSADVRARERVKDVLSEMQRSSRGLTYTFIDTQSTSGFDSYKRTLRELVTRDQRLIDEQAATVNLGTTAAQALGTYLTNELSPGLQQVQGSISAVGQQADNNRAYFEQTAASARLLAQDLTASIQRANELLGRKLDDLALPASDAAALAIADGLARCVDQMTAISRELRRFVEIPGMAGPPATAAKAVIPTLERQRDQASLLIESLRRLKRLDLTRISEVLQSRNAALLIGPPDTGIAAMDLDSLMPSTEWLDATNTGRADLGRRVEEVVTTALGTLITPVRPVVVMVHAEKPFFDVGQTLDRNFGSMVHRLRFHGIDIVEWSVITESAPTRLVAINPDGKRPVVYVTFPPDTSDGSEATGSTGVQRATKLAQVITDLTGSGKNVLLSINQNVMPTYGQADPVAPVLARYGIVADTGRPLMAETITPQGRLVSTDHTVLPEDSTGLLPGAVRGLPMLAPWAISFHLTDPSDKATQSTWPLYTILPSDRVWAEAQWLPMWQTPRQQRAMMPNAPVFDSNRDAKAPQGVRGEKESAWLVAVAVERRQTTSQKSQRVVAVGSREWLLNFSMQPRAIDGRTAAVTPGNIELLESSIFWLAGYDDLIAQSPTAQIVSLIQPMDEKVLSGLRMTMILGLPLVVLAIGVVYRLIRG